MKIDWSQLKRIIDSHQRFVLTTHVRPDADAIGSSVGMAAILEALGKNVRLVNASAIPARLQFLDPDKRWRQLGVNITEEEAYATDVHMILDTSAWGQLAEVGRIFRKTQAVKVVVDHHFSSEDLSALDLKDVESEATGALVFQAANYLGVSISPVTATALYCAIATDTGWFRFPSTSPETMRTIASLIECGAQPSEIYAQLYERTSLARMRLLSRALSRITLDFEGKVSSTYVRWDDYAETGADPADTEDMVNFCLSIAGVQAAFIQIEQSNTQIKTSFRSRVPFNVSEVAEKFNGGGHKQAAGAILAGPLAEARLKVMAAFTARFAQPD